MANTVIQVKKSGETGNTPSDLNLGELAINYADGKLFYKDSLDGISYIENQDGFNTIIANSQIILATTPGETLVIDPGTNITFDVDTGNNSITINSTATGGGGSGEDNVARAIANSKTYIFYQDTAPTVANIHDQWVDSSTGTKFQNIDGTTPLWVELGPSYVGIAADDFWARETLNAVSLFANSSYTHANLSFSEANVATALAFSASNTAHAAFTYANTAITTSGGSITGQLNVAFSPATTVNSAIQVTAANTKGGTGYADFLTATNASGGATNPNKYFRLTSDGKLEVVNSAYSATLFGLDNSGNLQIAGAFTPTTWTAGQVIKDTMLDNTQFTVNTTTVATSGTDTDFITYSYTPVSSSSYLIIHVHVGNYNAGDTTGTGIDSYISRIKVDGAEITYSRQYTRDSYTFRTGTLFPLTGRYTNSNTTAKSITVGVRRDSADDNISITNSSTALWMRITEIAR